MVNFLDKSEEKISKEFLQDGYIIKKIDDLTLDYMTDVYLDLEKLFLNIENKDNFIQSLNLNKQLITNFIK